MYIEIINAEIKALHFSAHLFYEKAEVKNKSLSIIQDFAVAKDYRLLKIRKLARASTQKNPHYKLAAEEDSNAENAEHGVFEKFVQLFTLRYRLRKMRDGIRAK